MTDIPQEEDLSTVGKRIAHCRKQLSLSQKDFADAVGTTRSSLGRWELDEGTPPLDVVSNLMSCFGGSSDWFDWLMHGHGQAPILRPPNHAANTPQPLGMPASAYMEIRDVSPLQLAMLDSLVNVIENDLLSNERCLELLNEMQALVARDKNAK